MFLYAAIYGVYFLACVGLYGLIRRELRLPIIWLGGWLLLPVSFYAEPLPQGETFPYWITGLALPSALWPNKLWVVNVTAVVCLAVYERSRMKRLRVSGWDAAMLVWCFWPLVQWLAVDGKSSPSAGMSVVTLLGTWGAAWFVGRVGLQSREELVQFLRWAVLLTAALLPLAVWEGLLGPNLYGFLWPEPHPFRFDGADRYIGFRPLLFFENGNQYGLWMSMVAVIAAWFWMSKVPLVQSENTVLKEHGNQVIAPLVMVFAVVSQSVGAIALMMAAIVSMAVLPKVNLPKLSMGLALLVILGGVLYVSNVIPMRRIAKETEIGRKTVVMLRQTGRGSFSWRIGQDERTLPLIRGHWMVGTGRWDWWRESSTRPWGYVMLLLGQFGILGVGLNLLVWLGTSVTTLLRWQGASVWSPCGVAVLCAVVILCSSLDGLLNAFLFVPATVLAAALVEEMQAHRWKVALPDRS